MTLMRNLDHIEMEIKEILKHIKNWSHDNDVAETRLEALRDFVISTREAMEDDHR